VSEGECRYRREGNKKEKRGDTGMAVVVVVVAVVVVV